VKLRLRIVAGLALCSVFLLPGSAQATGPTISGAGSTWAAIALDQWREEGARVGLNVNYQPVGSTAGRQYYIVNQVDFAASEIPFLPSEIAQLRSEHKTYQYLPDVAGGTAIMYNLKDASGHQVNNLRLSAATIAGIFTGRITTWNDPAIRRDNPHLQLPAAHLTPVIRSDGSGTSAKLADYLAHEAPSIWNPFAAANHVVLPVQFWPNFNGSVAVTGSDGMANYISNPSVGVDSIGYVEAGYVYQHSMVPAFIHNRSGNYAAPSSKNVALALTHVKLNPDLTENLLGVYNAPEPNAYPLASYSYLITQTKGFNPAKGAVLGAWIIHIACAGQQDAAPLGYSPLPPNLVAADFAAVRRIPGAPKPPPLTPQACPNPTITGAGYGGGPQDPGGSAPSSPSPTPASANSSGSGAKSHTPSAKKTSEPTDPVSQLSTAAGQQLVSVTPLSAKARHAAYVAGLHDLAAIRCADNQRTLWAAAVLALIFIIPAVLLGTRKRPAAPAEGEDA
jgi:phosphate transport system substrate-binding protein